MRTMLSRSEFLAQHLRGCLLESCNMYTHNNAPRQHCNAQSRKLFLPEQHKHVLGAQAPPPGTCFNFGHRQCQVVARALTFCSAPSSSRFAHTTFTVAADLEAARARGQSCIAYGCTYKTRHANAHTRTPLQRRASRGRWMCGCCSSGYYVACARVFVVDTEACSSPHS